MATSIRELLVSFGVDADTEALDAFDASIEDVKANLNDLVDFATKAAAAVAVFTGALVYQAVSTGESAEQIKEQAAALGITTDAYQELAYAMAGAGIDTEKITTIFAKLAVDQEAIAAGNEEVAATYAALGISAEEAAAATPEDLFAMMADGFASVTDASERLSIASTIFGDEIAASLIPVLSAGSEGLEEMATQAHDLGVVMSEEAIAEADAFNAQVETLTMAVEGFANKIGLAVIPVLTDLAERFLAWYEANQEVIDQQIVEYADAIASAFETVASVLAAVDDAIGGAEGWAKLAEVIAMLAGAAGVAYVAVKFALLVASIVEVVSAMAAFVGGGEILLALLGGIGVSIGLIIAWLGWLAAPILVFQDLLVYLEGGDSAFGRLIERFREAGGWLGSLANLMEAFGSVVSAVLGRAGQMWDAFIATVFPLVSVFEQIGSAIVDGIGGALDAVAPALDWMAGALNEIATLINGGVAPEVPTSSGAESTTAAGATGSTSAPSTSATMAPTTTATSAASSAFAPTASASSKSAAPSSVVVQGDTITITGVGITAEEAQALIKAHTEEKARATATSFAQVEV